MTSIRKAAFACISIGAFIYLVLQTQAGQQWLNKVSLLPSSTLQSEIQALTEKNEIYQSQISSVNAQLVQMQTSVDELKFELQKTKRSVSAKPQNQGQVVNTSMLNEGPKKPAFKVQQKDPRTQQREQQARLQEIVQRMELTALQAITR